MLFGILYIKQWSDVSVTAFFVTVTEKEMF